MCPNTKEFLWTPHPPCPLPIMCIGRTFPSHPYFTETFQDGQRELYNVLHAYSVADPEVGYCQGMSYIAGIFLIHVSASDSSQGVEPQSHFTVTGRGKTITLHHHREWNHSHTSLSQGGGRQSYFTITGRGTQSHFTVTGRGKTIILHHHREGNTVTLHCHREGCHEHTSTNQYQVAAAKAKAFVTACICIPYSPGGCSHLPPSITVTSPLHLTSPPFSFRVKKRHRPSSSCGTT